MKKTLLPNKKWKEKTSVLLKMSTLLGLSPNVKRSIIVMVFINTIAKRRLQVGV